MCSTTCILTALPSACPPGGWLRFQRAARLFPSGALLLRSAEPPPLLRQANQQQRCQVAGLGPLGPAGLIGGDLLSLRSRHPRRKLRAVRPRGEVGGPVRHCWEFPLESPRWPSRQLLGRQFFDRRRTEASGWTGWTALAALARPTASLFAARSERWPARWSPAVCPSRG